MSEVILSSMRDERDADDSRLLEEGKIGELLATYQPVVLGRCLARLRGDEDAYDVTQNVMLRLLAEFRRGKSYSVPYRVVVHQVVDWTLKDYFGDGDPTVPLPDGWEPAVPDSAGKIEEQYYLRTLFDQLPEKTAQVLELRYLVGLEIDQIAEQLDMERNAVDQALHRGHAKLRALIEDG